MTKYIICYDIRQPRRLLKVFNYLKQFALPIQYSVFVLDASPANKNKCLLRLQKLIDQRVDDIRCYVLAENLFQIRLGRSVLPDGIYLSSYPAGYCYL